MYFLYTVFAYYMRFYIINSYQDISFSIIAARMMFKGIFESMQIQQFLLNNMLCCWLIPASCLFLEVRQLIM